MNSNDINLFLKCSTNHYHKTPKTFDTFSNNDKKGDKNTIFNIMESYKPNAWMIK